MLNVIGLGYIGLPTAVFFAYKKNILVHGTDIDASLIDNIEKRHFSQKEPYLDDLLDIVIKRKTLSVSTDIHPSDYYIIAVPTPITDQKTADLSYIFTVIEQLAPLLKEQDTVIIESTVPPRTSLKVAEKIAQLRPDLRPGYVYQENITLYIAHCPERVLPGRIMYELENNDRIIGGITPACTQKAISLYQDIVKGTCFPTDATTAEMIKLSENTFRDINIAYANELSMICDHLEINVSNVIKFANCHPRVNILQPGPGVGGHCIAVDPWFIVESAPKQAQLIKKAREVNDSKPYYITKTIENILKEHPDKNILCLGVTYKPNVDDIRESPALDIATALSRLYPDQVRICDPLLSKKQKESLGGMLHFIDLESGLKCSQIIILLTNHDIFNTISDRVSQEQSFLDSRGSLLFKR